MSLFPILLHSRPSHAVYFTVQSIQGKKKKSRENKRQCFGADPGHTSLQMDFEPPIEEPQHEVNLASTLHKGEK